jgi:hypothetical protein
MKVFSDLKALGVRDILIAVTDELKGMAEALGGVFSAATLDPRLAGLPAGMSTNPWLLRFVLSIPHLARTLPRRN